MKVEAAVGTAELGYLASAVGKESCTAGWMRQSASSPWLLNHFQSKGWAAEPRYTDSIKGEKRFFKITIVKNIH